MSDAGNDNAAAGATATPQFTDRELQLLGWAMQCLKSGPPDIDYEKLAGFAGMSNPRSASNAWAKIRAKLEAGSSAPPKAAAKGTPKKKGAGAKAKAEAKEGEDGEAEEATATPKKTPRKRAAKKQDADGDASPKKKGRPAKSKKASEDDAADVKPEVKTEGSGDGQDAHLNGDATANVDDDEQAENEV